MFQSENRPEVNRECQYTSKPDQKHGIRIEQTREKASKETQQEMIIRVNCTLVRKRVPMNNIAPFGHYFVVKIKDVECSDDQIHPQENKQNQTQTEFRRMEAESLLGL